MQLHDAKRSGLGAGRRNLKIFQIWETRLAPNPSYVYILIDLGNWKRIDTERTKGGIRS
jgi:hypothetical protein